MKKFLISIFLAAAIFFPQISFAEEKKAEVNVVTDEAYRVTTDEGKQIVIERDLIISGMNDIEAGDKVVLSNIGTEEEKDFVISSLWRMPSVIFWLALFFIAIALLNRRHGLKSLLNLFVTFAVIFGFIIPFILKGFSPIFVSIIGAMAALTWSIYFTHGRNAKSHSAILSILISLLFSSILATIMIKMMSLTGFSDDGATFLVQLGYAELHIRGLLLAAMLVGAIGIMDDIVINQISVVEELLKENPDINKKNLLKASLKVGHDHTSSMINTLVLAYVGAAFPLMILLHIGEPPFDTLAQIFNNETIATEIARTIVGTLTLLVAMPISTAFAVKYLYKEETSENK